MADLGKCRDCGELSQYRYGTYCRAHQDTRYSRDVGKPFWQKRAIAYVHTAIARGVLPALDGAYACHDCGAPASEYDHRDYSKPLDVEPVCKSCNKQRGTAKWPSANDYQFAKTGLQKAS